MDEEWLRGFIRGAQWGFAKTMPESPHWYTLRRANIAVDFERAVMDWTCPDLTDTQDRACRPGRMSEWNRQDGVCGILLSFLAFPAVKVGSSGSR